MNLREQYNRDGYVVVKPNPLEGCEPEETLYVFAEILDFFRLSRIPDAMPEYLFSIMKTLFDYDIDRYMATLSLCARAHQEYFTHMRLVESIEDLGLKFPVGLSPVMHVMSSELHIPNGYYGTAAHQDWPSTQGSLDSVTVWIALTDAGIGNFPLEVIPGSHKQGLREGKLNGSVLEVDADDRDFIPIECKAGDVVFLSGFTVHRTGKGNGFRVAVSQRFDNADEPTFIERGYPCAQKRIVDREIRWRPTVEQVQKVFS